MRKEGEGARDVGRGRERERNFSPESFLVSTAPVPALTLLPCAARTVGMLSGYTRLGSWVIDVRLGTLTSCWAAVC